MKIDAYQNFWQPQRGDYDWMPMDNSVFSRVYGPYGPPDLVPILNEHGIDDNHSKDEIHAWASGRHAINQRPRRLDQFRTLKRFGTPKACRRTPKIPWISTDDPGHSRWGVSAL